ncbi:hypothetical protein JST56_07485 [Candidatus Dependentiae bacterium]|jgi:hypothetical protein|nr:hypothetical protein [Candidatus Dependentiae bacterium]
MKRYLKPVVGVGTFMLSLIMLNAADQVEQKAITANKSAVAQESQKLANTKPVRKPGQMAERYKARAAGAAQRRERLMAIREKRKKALEKRKADKKAQAGSGIKKATYAGNKPAAPQNNMLKQNNPIVLRNSTTQVKKS